MDESSSSSSNLEQHLTLFMRTQMQEHPPDDAPLALRGEDCITALSALHAVLNDLLDSVYTTSEDELSDKIEGYVQAVHGMIMKVHDSVMDDLGAIPEHDGEVPRIVDVDEDGDAFLDASSQQEGTDRRHQAQQGNALAEYNQTHDVMLLDAEMRRPLEYAASLLHDVGDTLLDLERDDIEELADVLLSVTRISLEALERGTVDWMTAIGRAIDYDWEARERQEEDRVVDLDGSLGQDELSNERQSSATLREGEEEPYVPMHLRRRRARRRGSRLLWYPLYPKLSAAVRGAPQELQAHPFKFCGTVAILLPVSGIVVVCLPSVLITDAVLQHIYTKIGPGLEDGREVAHLMWVMSRISMRQTYRLARKMFYKARAHPTEMAQELSAVAWQAATHPIQTVQGAWGLAKTGVSKVGVLLNLAKDMVKEREHDIF